MRTNFVNRVTGYEFFWNTTRREVCGGWDPHRRPPELVPCSRWTRTERIKGADEEAWEVAKKAEAQGDGDGDGGNKKSGGGRR